MMPDREDSLTPSEREAFARLPRAGTPPAELEERVVRALATRGLLRAQGRRFARAATLAGALAAVMIAGVVVGRVSATGAAAPSPGAAVPAPEGKLYVLLLLGGPTPASEAEEAALVREYGGWARSLGESGRYVTGKKLGEGGHLLDAAAGNVRADPDLAGFDALGGYFVIEAEDDAEAIRVAESCPHLRHGGRIVLRPIQPT